MRDKHKANNNSGSDKLLNYVRKVIGGPPCVAFWGKTEVPSSLQKYFLNKKNDED